MAKPRIDTPGQDDPGRGRRFEIDIGDVRVGVVVSNPDCILATPAETVTRATGRRDSGGLGINRLVELTTELEVVETIVSMPSMLDGSFGISTRKVTDVGLRLQRRLGGRVIVHYADERTMTVTAQLRLHAAGIDVKFGREITDQAAAIEILQSWLDRRIRALDGTTD